MGSRSGQGAGNNYICSDIMACMGDTDLRNNDLLERVWGGTVNCSSCKIRELVLFSQLSEDDFNHIHQPIHDFDYQQGSSLYHEGEQGKYIYTIRSGMVKLEAGLPDGTTKIVRLLQMGDVIGLEAVIGESYNHSAIALESGEICRIPVEVIQNLQEHSPRLCNELMVRWNKALTLADEWLIDLHSGHARRRVTRLIDYVENNSPHASEFLLPSRADMSSILGLTKETISRLVAELKRDGFLLDLGNGSFERKSED